MNLEEINQLHAKFWAKQSALMRERIVDPALYEVATRQMNSDVLFGVPLKSRKSPEKLLEDAETERSIFHREMSLKGGRASKVDALQGLLAKFVETNPKITGREALRRLKLEDGNGIVTDIDNNDDVLAGEPKQIHFMDRGNPKTAPLSGLKDRLTRAKKKILSR